MLLLFVLKTQQIYASIRPQDAAYLAGLAATVAVLWGLGRLYEHLEAALAARGYPPAADDGPRDGDGLTAEDRDIRAY